MCMFNDASLVPQVLEVAGKVVCLLLQREPMGCSTSRQTARVITRDATRQLQARCVYSWRPPLQFVLCAAWLRPLIQLQAELVQHSYCCGYCDIRMRLMCHIRTDLALFSSEHWTPQDGPFWIK